MSAVAARLAAGETIQATVVGDSHAHPPVYWAADINASGYVACVTCRLGWVLAAGEWPNPADPRACQHIKECLA